MNQNTVSENIKSKLSAKKANFSSILYILGCNVMNKNLKKTFNQKIVTDKVG